MRELHTVLTGGYFGDQIRGKNNTFLADERGTGINSTTTPPSLVAAFKAVWRLDWE